MDAIVPYLMLSVFLLAFVSFALSTAARLSSWTGGHARTSYWGTIFGGAGFIFLSLSGLIALPYTEGSRVLMPIIVVLFFALGGFLLHFGLKARKAALHKG